jgi:hypothetical protein
MLRVLKKVVETVVDSKGRLTPSAPEYGCHETAALRSTAEAELAGVKAMETDGDIQI